MRDDLPGAMMMPMFECNIRTAECCAEVIGPVCHQGNVNEYAVNVTTAQDVKTAVSWAA